MTEIDLPQGIVRLRDDGAGPPVVFVHGLLVDGEVWRDTVAALAASHRCVVPDLPLGCHRTAMRPTADQSPRGVARLVGDLLDVLDLQDVTLVGNDTGGALCQFLIDERPDRVARLVLTNCDGFEQFPPKPFDAMVKAARVPGLLRTTFLPARAAAVRRGPLAYGGLTKRGLPDAMTGGWVEAFLGDSGVRRDTERFLRAVDPGELLDVAARLRRYPGPVLLAWGAEDRFFDLALGRRLRDAFADARLEEVAGARTFVSWDQPARLAELIAGFVAAAPPAAGATPAAA
jgi:pimeloyl-ACP methyl ester carboxylesterase